MYQTSLWKHPTQSQPSAVTFRLNHSPHSSLSSLSSSFLFSSSSSTYSASNRPRSVNRSRRFSWFSCQWQNTFCFLCILVNIPKGGLRRGCTGLTRGLLLLVTRSQNSRQLFAGQKGGVVGGARRESMYEYMHSWHGEQVDHFIC